MYIFLLVALNMSAYKKISFLGTLEEGDKQLAEREKKKDKKSVSRLDQYQVEYASTA